MNTSDLPSIENKMSSFLSLSREFEKYSNEELVIKALQITPEIYKEKILNQNETKFKRVCSAPLYNGCVFFKCYDCNQDFTHVYCLNCMDKEKHKNHVITYHYSSSGNGYCDCGDNRILNKETFCDRHSQTEIKQQTPKEHFGEDFIKNYEEFLMLSFSILFKLIDQIVDYPYKYLEFVESIQKHGYDLDKSSKLPKLKESEIIVGDILKVNDCIFKILNSILPDNTFLAILTSQCFHKPIDEEIQKYSQMRHSHFQNQFSQFHLANSPEKCNCSILALFIKYQQFLCNLRTKNDFMQTFFQLQIEPNFNQFFCQTFVQNSINLYRPYFEYQVKLSSSHKYTVKINSLQFQQDSSYEQEFLKQILKSKSVIRIKIKNGVFESMILEYSDFFHGDIALELLRLYKETKNNEYYQIFDLNTQNLLFMPLCNESSFIVLDQFLRFLGNQFSDQIIPQLFDQFFELLGNQSCYFLEQDSASISQFRTLQNQSLLIYALTRSFPCSCSEAEVFGFYTEQSYEASKFEESLKIQNSVLTSYRNIVRIVCKAWNSEYQQYPQGFNNIMKIILNYYFNNFQSSFKLNHQNSAQITFFKNQVISDRNFISLLSAYLANFSDSLQAYQSLLGLNDQDQHKLNCVLHNLMKRTILSLIVLGNQNLYSKLIVEYFRNFKSSQISLEQVDLTYIQIYIFLFGANGINQIIDIYREISFYLKIKKDISHLIYRIASIDHEYFQTINFCQQNKISEEYKKSLSKLFQTVFYASSFLSYQQIIQDLQNISFENMMDFEQIILSSCELNQDNGQIELKQLLKPAHYEPAFSNKVPELKELINNKLRDQNDYYTELFGSSLQFELSSQSTLSQRRLIILKSISQDCQQQLLNKIVNELENQLKIQNYKKIQQCLEENSLYINLLSTINEHLNPQNQKLILLLDSILSICQSILLIKDQVLQGKRTFEAYIKLLGKQTITDEQEIQNKAKIIQKKKQILQQKFQQMSSKIQIIEQPNVQEDSNVQNCSLCYLPLSSNEYVYRLILIQKTNLHQYYGNMSEINNFNSFFKFYISACCHQFHQNCIMNGKMQELSNHFYFQCPICKQPYNFLLNVQEQIENNINFQIVTKINQYIQTLNKADIEYLYQNYSKENQLDVNYLSYKIFTQAICNLILQILQDVKPFLEKQYHIILQAFIKILQHQYQNGQENLLKDAFSGAESTLAKIISCVDQFIIQRQDPQQFKTSISQLLKMEQCELLYEIFFEKNVQIRNEFAISPYNIHHLRTQKSNELKTRFKLNFKEFLVEHLLTPCQKKKCTVTKFPEYQQQNNYAHQQVICLICFKKMCYYCKINSKNNINAHSLKKHEGKTLFILINSGSVCLLTFSNFTYFKKALFKNFIGEEPYIRCQGSEYYQRFQLNTKVIEEILDIILEERYLNVQFQNLAKIYKIVD